MNRSPMLTVLFGLMCAVPAAADDKPLGPTEARKKVGEKVTVEMTVRAAKDRLEKRGEIYLDSETDFRDEKNFAVVITKAGAASLKQAGIDDPAGHFEDRVIRATGTVKEVDGVPRIEIDDVKQIKRVEKELRKQAADGLKRAVDFFRKHVSTEGEGKATGDACYADAVRETAHALVRGQLRSGGWDYRDDDLPTHYGFKVASGS